MIYLYLLGCFIFVVLQGYFSAMEISFISSNILRLRHRQSKGDKGAGRVYKMLLKPEKFLATTMVGVNISVVLSSSFLTFFLMQSNVDTPYLWITFVFTPFVVIFAELIPKNIGRFFKEGFSIKAVGLIYFFERFLLPVINCIEALSIFLVKLFVKKRKYRSPFVTKEEIKHLVSEIEHQGGIDKGEREAIEEVFEFRSDKIKDFCLSLKNAAGFDYTDSRKTILAKVKKNSFTRYLVFKNKEIVGYVNIYDLFYNRKDDWKTFIRNIPKVGFNQKLYEVFNRLQSEGETIALVIKGKKAYGIITLHDITREIITSIIK
jgi:putative hemolysin